MSAPHRVQRLGGLLAGEAIVIVSELAQKVEHVSFWSSTDFETT